MAKTTTGKGSLIGAVGAIIIGAAMLLFVTTIVLNALKSVNSFGTAGSDSDDWNASNATIDQIQTFLTVITILLAVLGIVMVGASIIGYIGGAFGG